MSDAIVTGRNRGQVSAHGFMALLLRRDVLRQLRELLHGRLHLRQLPFEGPDFGGQCPTGLVQPGDTELITEPAPEPAEGEALVRTTYVGLDAAVRTWLNDPAQVCGKQALLRCTAGFLRAFRTICNFPAPHSGPRPHTQ